MRIAWFGWMLFLGLFLTAEPSRRHEWDARIIAEIQIAKPHNASIASKRHELYVTQPTHNTVSIVDVKKRRVAKSIQVCAVPNVVKTFSDESRIAVGCDHDLVLVELNSRHFASVPVKRHINDLVITQDGVTVWIASETGGLIRFDVRSRALLTVNGHFAPQGLALTPDEKFIWVNYQSEGPGGSFGHDAIAKFDVSSGKLIDNITGLANVGGHISISPDGTFLVADGTDACISRRYDHVGCEIVPSRTVNVIEVTSHRVIRQIPSLADTGPATIQFLPDGKRFFLSGTNPRICDSRSFRVQRVLDRRLSDIAFEPLTRVAYAASEEDNRLFVIVY